MADATADDAADADARVDAADGGSGEGAGVVARLDSAVEGLGVMEELEGPWAEEA